MLPLASLKIIFPAIILIVVGYGGYRAGSNAVEVKYSEREKAMVNKLAELSTQLRDREIELASERAKKAEVKIRTITKVRREIINQPTRDCGWTPAERVSINTAYCASFPGATDCMPDAVRDSTTSAGGQR